MLEYQEKYPPLSSCYLLGAAFTGLYGKYIGKAPPGSVKAAALMAAVNAQQGDTRVHVFKLVILNRVKTLHAPVSFSDDCHNSWRIFVSLHKDR